MPGEGKGGEVTDTCPHGIEKTGPDYCFPCVLAGGWKIGKGPIAEAGAGGKK